MRIPESMIEFSPFSIKGKKSLNKLVESMSKQHSTVEDIMKMRDSNFFLDNFYIEPFTRGSGENWINDGVSEEDKDVYDVKVLQSYKESFERELGEKTAVLFWISGNAGCGKSTYVHRLGQITQDKLEMIFSDFEAAKKRCIISSPGGRRLMIGKDALWNNSTLFKFLIVIIDLIIDNLNINQLDDQIKRNVFSAVVAEYYQHQDLENDFECVIEFFQYLKEINDDTTSEHGFENIYNFFCSIVSEFENTIDDPENGITNQHIINLMNILLQILLYKGNVSKKSQVCVFDNIEYFASLEYDIDKVLITDRSIEIILNCIHISVTSFVQQHVAKHNMFAPKVMVITRKATVAFNGNMEGNNYRALDITNWFCAKEIYQRRLDLISEYVTFDEKVAYNIFALIMKDCTSSKWSLVPFLSKLFNYNIRRMARILLYVLTINTTSSIRSEKAVLENFIPMWEANKEGGGIKHFLRMYIIRLVLDSFNGNPRELGSPQNVSYLNKLIVELGDIDRYRELIIPNPGEDLLVVNKIAFANNNNVDSKLLDEYVDYLREYKTTNIETSLTRRLLTILHRAEIDNIYTGNNQSVIGINYYDFEDLLKDLLLDGNNQTANRISSEMINKIAKILYLMNEVTDSTGWVPLTSIKWKGTEEKYTLGAITKVLESAMERLRNHQEADRSYGIRITYAGQIFLMLLPEFEYFAARFCPFEPKLLSDRSMRKDKNEFLCVKSIKTVMYYSVMCSYTVILRAMAEYSVSGTSAKIDYDRMHHSNSVYKELLEYPLIMHSERIFRRQYNYLEIYKQFVSSLQPSNSRFTSDKEKKQLINQLDSLIKKLKDWESYFIETYRNYFLWEE